MNEGTPSPAPLVDIRDLQVTFTGGRAPVRAVSGVSLQVQRGEAVALIGESGSGKSVTLRTLLMLHPPRRTQLAGRVRVAGHDVLTMAERKLADYRGVVASMIFQEPLLALDPVFERVRIPSPERRLAAYPHEMSGGMRQRAMIALALACRPQVLLADEPTTALDATVQIQVLILLRELQRELGLAIVFVTHDIGAALEVADRIAVMYAGRIVEEGTARELIQAPRHPYTLALLRGRAHGAMAKGHRLQTIGGAPPDLAALPPGCAFAERCSFVQAACRQTQPEAVMMAPGHRARCLRTDATAAAASTS